MEKRNKIPDRTLKLFIVIAGLICTCHSYAYSATTDSIGTENWMKLLPDETLITEISIPGSHNSFSYNTSLAFSKCQSYPVEEQLTMGVRYLDIRVVYKKGGKLQLYHGWDNLHISLDSCLATIQSFLDTHPSEIILLRLQREKKSGSETDDMYYDAMVSAFQNAGLPMIDMPGLKNRQIGNLRGKALIIEYNNMEQNIATYPFLTGYSYWGYLSSDEQIDKKWKEIQEKELIYSDSLKFNRLNLYSSGGRKMLGATIPNPKSFTAKFAIKKINDILAVIRENAGKHYIYIVDFEELYMDEPGALYKEIIRSNFTR